MRYFQDYLLALPMELGASQHVEAVIEHHFRLLQFSPQLGLSTVVLELQTRLLHATSFLVYNRFGMLI